MTNLEGAEALKTRLRTPGAYRGTVGTLFLAVCGPDPADIAAHLTVYPRCAVSLMGWTQDDKTDPVERVQKVNFELEVTTLVDAATDPEIDLDVIVQGVKGLINGSGLGGTCIPPLSSIDTGRYLKYGGGGVSKLEAAAAPKERRIWMFGTFAYYEE